MLYFKKEGELHRVCETEVIYIQQSKRNVIFSTEKGEYFVKNFKIENVEERLKDCFFKCHSYMMVNTAKINVVKPGEVIFEDGTTVGMCRAAADRVKKELQSKNVLSKNCSRQ